RGRKVVEDAGVPAGVLGLAPPVPRDREALPGAGEVGRFAGTPEEDGHVVVEARPVLAGLERELGQNVPQLLGEIAGPRGLALVAKPLLEPEEIPVRLRRRRPESVAKCRR